ncbi:MAG: 50S ribosomal protein L22, partial [Caldilinea sp.]
MEIVAKMKYTGISAQKTRLVINEIRGRQAEEALALLSYMPQSAARVVSKTVKS